MCVDIEVIDTPLDYNILLGCSYTYAMSFVPSAVHHKMFFPHNGNIFTIDQLNYHEPNSQTSPESTISTVTNQPTVDSLTIVSHGVYKESSLLGNFPGPPPPLVSDPSLANVFMMQSSQAGLS